jgi:uncharacterized protein YndB with AHSA1/START domain
MNHATPAPDPHGVLAAPGTLTIRRLLPGPIERVWAFIVDEDLRRTWLAAGPMDPVPGAAVEFVWRNDTLSAPDDPRPPGASAEIRLTCTVLEADPPRRLKISWGSTGGVTFDLAPDGERVLLTVTHHRIPDRTTLLNVGAGWHMHLDILAARAAGRPPASFWSGWRRLRGEYDRRLAE